MNDDPIRLLAQNGSSRSLERSTLRAGVGLSPPAGAKAAIWTEISGKLPPSMTGQGSNGASTGGSLVGVWKAGAIGVALGLLVAGGVAVLSPPTEQQTARTTAAATPTTLEPASGANAAEAPAAPAEVAVAAPRAAAPHSPPIVPPTENVEESIPTAPFPAAENAEELAEKKNSQLVDETRVLRDARSVLRSGNASGALALLASSSKKYPAPVLGQEHEALSIQALHASGAHSQAKTRAQAFVARFPSSPLTAQLRSIAESP